MDPMHQKWPAPGMTIRRTKLPVCFSAVTKRLRLRFDVDDVVLGAIGDEERGRIVAARHIAQRRALEIDLAVVDRRRAEEFLGDLVARPADEIVLPLRRHVVDAVKPDAAFDLGADRAERIALRALGENRLIAGERDQRRELRPGAVAPEADALGIDLEIRRRAAQILHRRAHVLHRFGIAFLLRLAEPVIDREERIAGASEMRAPTLIGVARAELPAAAMDDDQRRKRPRPLGR